MTRQQHARTRAFSALASAGITAIAIAFMALIWTPPSRAQECIPDITCEDPSTTTSTTLDPTSSTPTTEPNEQWDGSRFTGPTASGETVSDGTFTGVFVHQPSTPHISQVDLTVTHTTGSNKPLACPAPGTQPTQHVPAPPSTTTPSPGGPEPSTAHFLFEVAFECNGIYDATATATLDGIESSQFCCHELPLTGLKVAVPPQPPLSLSATDNGNRTVTVAWQPPNDLPPDFAGFRVSRRAASAQDFDVSADVGPDKNSAHDPSIPESGGSYVYKVESLRNSPNGVLLSVPVTTSDALQVGGVDNPTPGRTVSGSAPPSAKGTGTQHFDQTTELAADEEPGDDLPFPGAGAIQRFTGGEGAGLIKPFAAALDLGVWAALLLFLTRRASRAEKADLVSARAVAVE